MPPSDTPADSSSAAPGAEDGRRRFPFSRRSFIAAGAAVGATAALQPAVGAPPAAAASAEGRLAAGLPDPAGGVRAKFRWWWPHGMVDLAEIRREIDQIADAGFGGVEIADVHHSVSEPLDPENTGWGTKPWRDAVEAALSRAERRGIKVDLTIGPAWPAAVPSITPQDPAAMHELAHGVRFLQAGEEFSGPLPEPAVEAAEGVTERTLFAIQALRLADGAAPEDSPITLKPDTLADLTSSVDGEELSWTAPAEGGGTWALIAYWQRGTGQRPERGPHTEPVSYVVDHFSAAGTRAVTDFWDEHILTDRVRKLLKGPAGGAIFEDSIEMETDATLWTRDLPAAFEAHTGYNPLPYLPVLVRAHEDKVFSFDSTTDRRALDDFNDVLTQLYVDHHITPIKKWAHRLGLRYRIQPYGLQTDAVAKAALVDIPEGESLGFKNLDDFRSLAGGRDLGGNTVLSSEAGAVYGGSYSTTWRQTVRTISREYAAGVNQAVLHGFSYADAPGAQWPGFAAFTPYSGGVGYSESWGPRHPTWQHVADVSGFFARCQHALQWGTSTVDVAFLRQKGYAGSGFGAAYFSSTGVREGWSHQFVSPRLLEITDPQVKDGVLAPDGPAYRLLVFEGDAFNGRVATLPLETARRLLRYAKNGLKILVVGDWSAPQQPGVDQGEAGELAETVRALLDQPTVHRVGTREEIAAGIAALGAAPSVRYAKASPLLHARRRSRNLDLYYLTNGSNDAAVDHDVTFATDTAQAYPFSVNLWTGEVAPLPVHRVVDGGVRVRVRLAPGASTAVAVARPQWARDAAGRNATPPPGELKKLRFEGTDADAVRVDERGARVRAGAAGTYRTVYAGGRTVSTEIRSVGEPRELTRWRLEVEDWRPGSSATETEVRTHTLDLDGLAPWTELDGLADVSGIGRYTAEFDLGKGWTGGYGAYLDLGAVTDVFRVTVNGKDLPPCDQLDTVVDLGDRLRRGKNTIEVEVSTTLINRMRVFRPDVYGSVRRQQYGLMGPVWLRPYGEAEL
ncbi:glycosyl hydrolase [Streptomonospora nanhaiensis]|uniref:glycosyl hydrolase n=1 Tax=Streptomonospora nanhaiensis TaxID=1323731 RepID=UPI001C3859F4|nr:glycosyl hydrolase [Streptomonospora nanhaiensis]MBV2362278.1 alpha-L-rhamnosidase [Streptomonospora nanhaiensis]